MYVVAIFALALLSPLPFVSPFVYDVQNVEAQIPFDTSDRDISSPIETAPQKFDSYDLTSSTDNTNNQSYCKSWRHNYRNFYQQMTYYITMPRADQSNDKDASVSIFNIHPYSASITVLETDPDGYYSTLR